MTIQPHFILVAGAGIRPERGETPDRSSMNNNELAEKVAAGRGVTKADGRNVVDSVKVVDVL